MNPIVNTVLLLLIINSSQSKYNLDVKTAQSDELHRDRVKYKVSKLTRSSPDDQRSSSAIISVQFTDKLGRLKTLRGSADKLLVKRRRPLRGKLHNQTCLNHLN